MQKKRREDDILLYKYKTNRQAFSASLRDGSKEPAGHNSREHGLAAGGYGIRLDGEKFYYPHRPNH